MVMDILTHPPTVWLVLAVVLAALELIVPGVFLIWIAAAAGVTGLASYVIPLGLAGQLILFALLCALSVWLGRRWYLSRPVASSDPLLNDRAARLIGDEVEVIEAIAHGSGRVKVGDGVWTARGPDCPVGTIVRISGVRGAELLVERLG